ncbi:MAG TPA: hypothetical protein VN520_18825 [Streptomyces sp.]|uniref:hypothetical protein n=1 Tax=Streptomyces sp. TaxID=1931 RepID=UPI002C69B0C4|nr:hypothetical protein [Streptomyces sp.]HWU08403.1 hypothetical protein [Streptomyces sp.]
MAEKRWKFDAEFREKAVRTVTETGRPIELSEAVEFWFWIASVPEPRRSTKAAIMNGLAW